MTVSAYRPPLLFDSWEEARDADIQASGGRKKVSAKLWPHDKEDTRMSRIRAACAAGHSMEFKPADILSLKVLAKEAGSTAMIDFEARTLHYEVVWPSPEATDARLKQAFIDAVNKLGQIQRDMTANGQRVRAVR